MKRVRIPPSIIDIEASGFGPHGYPIEVGVALHSGATCCYLIQPMPEWVHWDEGAERVHRIPRDILEVHGKPIDEVARRLNEALEGQTVYSDGWQVDKPWLIQLFHAAGVEPAFQCSMLDMILSEAQMERWHPTKDQVVRELDLKRHRASLDALIIQKTYVRTHEAALAAPLLPA